MNEQRACGHQWLVQSCEVCLPTPAQPQAEPSAEWLEKAEGIIARYRDRRVDSLHVSIALALQSEASARASTEQSLKSAQQENLTLTQAHAQLCAAIEERDVRLAEITRQRDLDTPIIQAQAATIFRLRAESSALAQKAQEAERDFTERMRNALLVNEQRLDEIADLKATLRALPSAPPIIGVCEAPAGKNCAWIGNGCDKHFPRKPSAPPAAHKLSDRYPLPWTPAAVAEANAVIAAEHPAPPATPETPPNYWREPWWHQDCGTPHGPADPCPLPAPATPETPKEEA